MLRHDIEVDEEFGQFTMASLEAIPNQNLRNSLIRFIQDNPTESIIDLEDVAFDNDQIKIHRFFAYFDESYDLSKTNWLVYFEFDAKVCREEKIQ